MRNAPSPTMPTLRSAGIAEVIDEFSIGIPLAEIHQFLNQKGSLILVVYTNITNRLMDCGATEVELVSHASQNPITKGKAFSSNGIEFNGVFPLTAKSSDRFVDFKVKRLRVNANQLSWPAILTAKLGFREAGSSDNHWFDPIHEFAKIEGPGFQCELVSKETSLSRMNDLNKELVIEGIDKPIVSSIFKVRFREASPHAFKNRAAEGSDSLSQPGDCGTRFLVRFNGIPDGVSVFVSTLDLGNERSAQWIDADANGAPSRIIRQVYQRIAVVDCLETTMVRVEITSGCGYAVWEFMSDRADKRALAVLDFCVVLAWQEGHAVAGKITVNAGLAPISTVTTMSVSAPIPRFADISRSIPTLVITE